MNWIIIAKIKIFKDRLMSWGILINFLMLLCLTLGVSYSALKDGACSCAKSRAYVWPVDTKLARL